MPRVALARDDAPAPVRRRRGVRGLRAAKASNEHSQFDFGESDASDAAGVASQPSDASASASAVFEALRSHRKGALWPDRLARLASALRVDDTLFAAWLVDPEHPDLSSDDVRHIESRIAEWASPGDDISSRLQGVMDTAQTNTSPPPALGRATHPSTPLTNKTSTQSSALLSPDGSLSQTLNVRHRRRKQRRLRRRPLLPSFPPGDAKIALVSARRQRARRRLEQLRRVREPDAASVGFAERRAKARRSRGNRMVRRVVGRTARPRRVLSRKRRRDSAVTKKLAEKPIDDEKAAIPVTERESPPPPPSPTPQPDSGSERRANAMWRRLIREVVLEQKKASARTRHRVDRRPRAGPLVPRFTRNGRRETIPSRKPAAVRGSRPGNAEGSLVPRFTRDGKREWVRYKAGRSLPKQGPRPSPPKRARKRSKVLPLSTKKVFAELRLAEPNLAKVPMRLAWRKPGPSLSNITNKF